MIERRCLLVAYEMGLGKTVITIAALERLLDEGTVGCGIVFAPASLKYQWERQIEKFTDGKAWVIVIDGTPAQRKRLYRMARTGEYDYIILNYEQSVNDWAEVRSLPRDFVVCDEVTAIKGFKSKRSRRIKRMQSDYRFGLSGQPLENRPEELYSIMQWVDEEVLGRFDIFDNTFIVRNAWGKPLRYRNLPVLHRRISEAMVRKTWEDVPEGEKPLVVEPPPLLIEMDVATRSVYRRIVRDLKTDLEEAFSIYSFDLMAHYGSYDMGAGAEMQAMGQIMAKLTCLRMLCDHPELLRLSADKFDNDDVQGGAEYASMLKAEGLLDGLTIAPKMREVRNGITAVLNENPNNKVVLFSYFKPTLSLLQQGLGFGSTLFTGDMTAKAKDASKTKFQTDPNTRVFLSSDAGGYGVDLPEANYLINYDLPWSAGKLDQRNARIRRLSTEWPHITILNYLMAGSIEERQFAMLEQKGKIASAVIDGKGHDTKGQLVLDLQTLAAFLEDTRV